jgi:spore germination cell wall hydrolase CwlJ-like protein
MTTTMSLSHTSYKAVINSIKLLIFGLGLSLTIFAVYGITDTKLRNLKIEENVQIERLHNAILTENLKQVEAIKTQQAQAEKLKQLECLARNVYWEAAAEPFEGKVAVAQVTMNRLESGKFGNSICQVVFQRTKVYETVICQFSWTCTGKSRVPPRNQRLFKESEDVARKVYFENYRLPNMTKAMYFHNTTVRPGWNKVKITQIGQHIFYRD